MPSPQADPDTIGRPGASATPDRQVPIVVYNSRPRPDEVTVRAPDATGPARKYYSGMLYANPQKMKVTIPAYDACALLLTISQ